MGHWPAVSARSAWSRLESWCQRHHPRLLGVLNPGASVGETRAVEQAIGRPLPPDVRESFAIHSGGERFLFGFDLLTLELLVAEWQTWRGLEGHNEEFRDGMESSPKDAIALDYANPGWIPLTHDPGGNHLGVDLAPGPTGTVGQVINFGRNEEHKCVLASGWAEFLADFATFLESGAVSVADPDHLHGWFDACGVALGERHCHDALRQWRRDGRWPPRQPPW